MGSWQKIERIESYCVINLNTWPSQGEVEKGETSSSLIIRSCRGTIPVCDHMRAPKSSFENLLPFLPLLPFFIFLFLFPLSFFSNQMSSSAISSQLKEPKLTWIVWMNRHLNESDSWLGHTSGVTAATHLVLISSRFGIFYFFGYKTQSVLIVLFASDKQHQVDFFLFQTYTEIIYIVCRNFS